MTLSRKKHMKPFLISLLFTLFRVSTFYNFKINLERKYILKKWFGDLLKYKVIFFSFLFYHVSAISQNSYDLDTIKITYFSSAYKSSGPNNDNEVIYSVDGKTVSESYYLNLVSEFENFINNCTPCFVKSTYNSGLTQSLSSNYLETYFGKFIEYHKNGNISIEGNYSSLNTHEISILKSKYNFFQFKKRKQKGSLIKKIGFKEGEWNYYDLNGQLIRKDYYKNGKLIKK